MMMYLLYWVLLVLWVLLLWPTLRLKGGARLWLFVVIAAGIAALGYEIRMLLWSHAAIRLDILLFSIALACLYGFAALLLFVKEWRQSAALLAVVLVLVGGGMSFKWIQVGRESERLGKLIDESNRLLFRAKFRSPEDYERYFGPFSTPSADHPIGHWRIKGQSHLTRLIVNAEGRVWLFYQCQEDAECHYSPDGSGLRRIPDQAQRWEAALKAPVGLPVDIKIAQTQSDQLSVTFNERDYSFVTAPPPIDPAPAKQSLRLLGPFTRIDCSRAHATVRQIWLWEDHTRRYGVGIFSTLVAGRQNRYVPLVVMGAGQKENGDWRFAWDQEGRSGTALVTMKGGDAILTLDLHNRDLEDTNQATLKSGGIFSDERIALAPLTGDTDWHHWFDTVFVGHFISGFVPPC